MRNKYFLVYLLWACLIVSFIGQSRAQGTVEALTIITSARTFGLDYIVSGGIGWSFVPAQNILITGVEASAPQVSFWKGSNQVLATFNVSNPTFIPSDSFESIAPLLLYAGQTYLVSCQNVNFSGVIHTSGWGLLNVAVPQPDGPAPFFISQYINQYGSYSVSPSGQWSPENITTPAMIPYTASLLYGPNFQFQVVPEPSCGGLSICGFVCCIFSSSIALKRLLNFE